jgi:V8-like Glu-specific endopeptidase
MAFIHLANSPNTGWMSFGFHNGLHREWRLNTDGFPVDKTVNDPDSGRTLHTMWNSFGAITDATNNHIDLDYDIMLGNSGGPVYLCLQAQHSLVTYGVQSNHFTLTVGSVTVPVNSATWINGLRFRLICALMQVPSIC